MGNVKCDDLALPDIGASLDVLRQQSDAFLSAGGRVVALRNTSYTPLFVVEDYDRALVISDALVVAAPDNVLVWRDRASLLLRCGDHPAAVRAANALSGLLTGDDAANAGAWAQVIQVYLSAHYLKGAMDAAQTSQPLWSQDARLCQLAMTALYRATKMAPTGALAATAAETLLAHGDAQSDKAAVLKLVVAAAPVLMAVGKAHRVQAALMNAGADASEDPRVLFELGRAVFMANPAARDAGPYLESCLQLDPAHKQARDILARIALSHGDAAQAVYLLEGVDHKDRSVAVHTQLARAYLANQQAEEAVDIYKTLSDADPGNIPLSRQYAGAVLQTGQGDAARDIYQAALDMRAAHLDKTLPGSLADVISNLYRNPPTNLIPRRRLDWIYNVLTDAGRAPADRVAWETQINILNRIDHLLLDWVECRPERRDELRAVMGITDVQTPVKDALDTALAHGQGAFVVNAHLGVLFGGPLFLELSGYKMAWLASVPKLGLGDVDENLISTTTMDDSSIGRGVLSALRKGAVVTIAIDGSANRQDVAYPLFDRHIKLSDFVPRLAYRRRVPTFFPRLPFVDGQLQPELIRLPDPVDGETADDFTQRWMENYLENIKRLFYEVPSTLRGSGGFWTGITN